MQIADYLGQYANALANASSAAAGKTAGTSPQNLTAGFAQMQEGTVFEGSINAINGQKVLLGLANGQTVAARLEGNVQLALGQSLFFQVKSNDSGTIAIKPYTGGAFNPTIQKALDAAGMEMSADTLEMVNKMMEEGLPIDKASLTAMRQTLLQNPQVSMQTAISMTRFGIPVTPQLAAQFENYSGDRHVMLTQMRDVMEGLPSVFADHNADTGKLLQLNEQVVKILGEGLPKQETTPALFENARAEGMADAGDTAKSVQTADAQGGVVSENTILREDIAAVSQKTVDAKNVAQQGQQAIASENPQQGQADISENMLQSGRHTVSDLLGKQQFTSLEAQIKQVFPDMEQARLNGQSGAKDLLDALTAYLRENAPADRDALARLFSGKEYHTLLKAVMEEQWLVKPEDLKTEHKVEELYENLNRQMEQIEQLARHAGIKSGGLSEAAAEVRSNIDFMNQINQAYTYVQIPLKMANQNAHSDLYVYTNKRNLQKREGELSAFLHLELDHLGTTDVSIRMLDNRVSTKFYLADDISYELLEKHMPRLEERLKALGYHCTITMENREEKVDFVEDFLQKSGQGTPSGAPARGMVHRYSFDVRA